jgi:hypothetical protein
MYCASLVAEETMQLVSGFITDKLAKYLLKVHPSDDTPMTSRVTPGSRMSYQRRSSRAGRRVT